MKNTIGNALTVTLFGESHGEAIGAVLDGLAPGIAVDMEYIRARLLQRRPYGAAATKRREPDEVEIISGVFNGRTSGTPLTLLIRNCDTKSEHYDQLRRLPRPAHADLTAYYKYGGYQDYRGGGHFSGRITAALVAAGAIVMKALLDKGICIGTHISCCHGVCDRQFADLAEDIAALANTQRAILSACAEYVKEGGALYYSTCSVFEEENDVTAGAFLKSRPDFSPQTLDCPLGHMRKKYGLQFLPHLSMGAGFYVAKFIRSRT